VYVCFRGTDSTMVGWRENFMMAYESPVPAQRQAEEYLARCAKEADGPLFVVGHSKGGNLAAWSMAHLPAELQDRVQAVYSFDGPGMDDATVADPGYQRILPRLHSVIPQGSVVGLLLNYHEKYQVVRSVRQGIWQHDPFSWQISGDRFEEAERLDRLSQVTSDAIHDFLKTCGPAEREAFVEAIFDTVDDAGVEKL